MGDWQQRWHVHSRVKPAIPEDWIPHPQEIGHKPSGLWFTPTSGDWWDWMLENQPNRATHGRVSPIEVDASRILLLTTPEDVVEFHEKYVGTPDGYPKSMRHRHIDWTAVQKDHDGIEIVPYQWNLRLDHRVFWYYTWDVASGCVWRERSVRLPE